MVTLQILVLSFLVRIQVAQLLREIAMRFLFFLLPTTIFSFYFRIFTEKLCKLQTIKLNL